MSRQRRPYNPLEIKERDFQLQVREYAGLCGWVFTYHTHDSRRSDAGFPDLIMIRGQRLVAAELKRERGRPTDDQRAWIDAFNNVPGCEGYIWFPSSWPHIEQVLAR